MKAMKWSARSAWRSLRLKFRGFMKAALPSRAPSPSTTGRRRKLGALGEQAAKRHLARQGHRILHTNYRHKLGELDIVSERRGCVVFTEVKARVESPGYRPADNVHARKQAKLRKLGELYLRREKLWGKPAQFDVIEVVFQQDMKGKPRINHIEKAF
jgi:putative endonuclease